MTNEIRQPAHIESPQERKAHLQSLGSDQKTSLNMSFSLVEPQSSERFGGIVDQKGQSVEQVSHSQPTHQIRSITLPIKNAQEI